MNMISKIYNNKFKFFGQFRKRNCPIWLPAFCAVSTIGKGICKKATLFATGMKKGGSPKASLFFI